MPWMQSLLPWFKRSMNAAKLVTYGAILLCLLAGYGWLKAYLVGPDERVSTIYRFKPKPVVVTETKYSEKIRTVVKEVRVEVKVPTEAQKEKLEGRFGYKLGIGEELLGEWNLPRAPYGGTTMVTVKPDGTPTVVTVPNAQPFFELGGMREFGAEYGMTSLGRSWQAFYHQDLLRVGPVWVGGRAAFGDPGNGKAQWSVMASASVRF